jgi:hypothetical protein
MPPQFPTGTPQGQPPMLSFQQLALYGPPPPQPFYNQPPMPPTFSNRPQLNPNVEAFVPKNGQQRQGPPVANQSAIARVPKNIYGKHFP